VRFEEILDRAGRLSSACERIVDRQEIDARSRALRRARRLRSVNQSTLRYDNSDMNNIRARGVVRAYLSSGVPVASDIGLGTPDIGYQEQP